MNITQLTAEEKDVLRDVLTHEIETIKIEVFHTDTHEFKEMLKRRRVVLEQLLDKMNAASVST